MSFDPGSLRVRRADGYGAGRFDAMASPCEVLVEAGNRRVTRRLTEIAAAEVQRIEAKFSRYRSDSVLARLHAAGGVPCTVDAVLIAIDGEPFADVTALRALVTSLVGRRVGIDLIRDGSPYSVMVQLNPAAP